MTSKPDDDTLPLQGFSQDLSIDITVDEDFIPASQPHSNESSKGGKKSESSLKSEEIESRSPNNRLSVSTIETSVMPNVTLNDNDKSADFIPETETKKRKLDYTTEDSTCRKKIQIDENLMKCTEDMFDGQADASWNLVPMKESESLVVETQEVSKVPETPVPGTQELTKVPESPQNISAFNVSFPNVEKMEVKSSTPALSLPLENEKRNEHSVTEIIVNDSAETIDLDTSENLSVVEEKKVENKIDTRKIDASSCFISDVERFEETQIFDHSSALVLEAPGGDKENEKPHISTISQNMYMQETIECRDGECKSEDKSVSSMNGLDLPAMSELSKELSEEPANGSESSNQIGDIAFKNEPKASSTAQNSPEASNSTFLQTKKMEFKLVVSCMVTMNVKTKEVVQKLILNVKEVQKNKPKPMYFEHVSDSTDKSKRSSMSSSGSVYSDKIGLPFALPKRVSAVSDQTDTSDSSEEGFSKRLKEGKKVLGRTPWSNEYLLPLKMDELIKTLVEEQDLPHRQNGSISPSKHKNTNMNEAHHLEEILESSSSEETSICNGDVQSSKSDSRNRLENLNTEKENSEGVEKVVEKLNEEQVQEKATEREVEKSVEETSKCDSVAPQTPIRVEEEEPKKVDEEDDGRVTLCDGLSVMARWTDKRYYSGTLTGNPSSNRWMMKFDDGTTKKINENYLMPAKWLKKGELVFVLVNDQYVSGKIIDIKHDQPLPYVVELDTDSNNICVKLSDICLTEVMAGIVKEKYKPFSTPGGKVSSEIDFDNVVSGKRHREQRTPLKPPIGQPESVGKKKSTKGNKDSSTKETPQKSEKKNVSGKINGLRSENGHLVEDKTISTDSPSGNETGETPCRSSSRETRGKAKPRSLSYETKDKTETTSKLSDWLAPDGTPIPGPSGVKFKKRTKPGAPKVKNFQKSVLNSVEEESSTPKRAKKISGKSPGSAKSSPAQSELKSTEKIKGKRNSSKAKEEDEKTKKEKSKQAKSRK